jgi:hypothetical protein
MSDVQPTIVAAPCTRQVRQLFEAAGLLQASRPDLAEVCRDSGCGLLEVSELAFWPAPPRAGGCPARQGPWADARDGRSAPS